MSQMTTERIRGSIRVGLTPSYSCSGTSENEPVDVSGAVGQQPPVQFLAERVT